MAYEDGMLYILIRKDMNSLNHAGKMVAQGAHAANHAADMLNNAKFGVDNRTAWMTWEKSTEQAFGSTIVLGKIFNDPLTIQDIQDTVQVAIRLGYAGAIVHDPTYPLQDGQTLHSLPIDTCGWIFGSKADLAPVLKYLKLHPEDANPAGWQ
jgi:Peptidyl-tRNA hydrolase PTH2